MAERKEIRITDQQTVKRILAHQRAEGDRRPTHTVAKIVDRYFESRRKLGAHVDILAT